MHSLKPIVLVSLGAIAAATDVGYGCNSPTSPASVSTVFITVPSVPITETLYAVSQGSFAVESAAATSETATTTVTNSITSTKTISIVQATYSAGPGVYSFTLDNNTTLWMGGKTPPATVSLITETSFVTLQPVATPVSTFSQGSHAESTSYLTLFSTIIEAKPSRSISEEASLESTSLSGILTTTTDTNPKVTETIAHLSVHGPSASAGLNGVYSGLAPSGWNATKTTMTTLLRTNAGLPISELASKQSTSCSASYTLTTSINVTVTKTLAHSSVHGSSRSLKPRQVGAFVVASVDGALVSWTNEYDGQTPTTLEPPEIPVSVTALAPVVPSSSITSPIRASPEYPHTLVPVTATAPAFGPFPTSTSVAMSEASETSIDSIVTSLSGTQSSLSQAYTNTSTSSSTAATTTASACEGLDVSPLFLIDFDDLPHFSTDLAPSDTDVPPIFNPYRKLYFEGHFGYVPPPTDPFPPHSPPQLAVYQEVGLNISASPDAGLERFGEIGAGPRASDSAYWIDAYSAWLGCANSGPDECFIEVKGYAAGVNESIISQSFTQPPCPGLQNCLLGLVEFSGGFKGLNGLQIIATVADKPVTWYMDDLALGWSNNTCAAQLERSSSE